MKNYILIKYMYTWRPLGEGEKGNPNWILAGKTEGNRPLVRPRRMWEHNVKMDLREIRWSGVDWIHLAQDRDQWRAMNLRAP
jgi:hypothetical protein